VYDTLDKESEHSSSKSISEINKIIECTAYVMELSKEKCNLAHHNLEVFDMNISKDPKNPKQKLVLPDKKSCLVVGNLS
jgi:hypothetical protein